MSICIECAVRYHDFVEVPSNSGKRRDGGKHPEALIDGRKHRLDRVGLYHMACDHCCRVSGNLFLPAET